MIALIFSGRRVRVPQPRKSRSPCVNSREKRFSTLHGERRGRKLLVFRVPRAGVLCALVLTLCVWGCRSSPDLQPFAGATAQLATSIKMSSRTLASEIDAMSAGWDKEHRNAAMQTAEKFEREWVQRKALADALVEYSASLTTVVEAGEQGEKSATALAASFKTLCDAIGVALPATTTAAGTVNTAVLLYGKFARDRAAKTLGEGMERLQPAIDDTAKELGNSLLQIETGLDAIRDQNSQNIEDEFLDGAKVSTHRGDLKAFAERRGTLLATLRAATKLRDDLAESLLKASDPAKEQEFERLSPLIAALTAELATIDASIKVMSDKLAPIDARKAADHSRLTAGIALVRTVRDGLGDWAAAHSRLAAAALERKPVRADDLAQTALEVRDLVKTIRTMSQKKE